MEYFIVWIEGIISFISPCLLPMLPMYLSYFAGEKGGENKKQAFLNSLGFVIGFTIVFLLLGIFASTFGKFIHTHITMFNFILGLIVVLFGCQYIGILKISFLQKAKGVKKKAETLNFLSAILFGMVFSVAWTPCVGAFLGSALLLTATYGEMGKGIIMLLLYSFGLGIPFIISSLFLEQLKTTFQWIQKHYKIINLISGVFLIIIGIFMMFGINQMVLGQMS